MEDLAHTAKKPQKPPRTAHIAIKMYMEALPNFRIMLKCSEEQRTWAGRELESRTKSKKFATFIFSSFVKTAILKRKNTFYLKGLDAKEKMTKVQG